MQGFTQGFTKQNLTELWGAVYRILETQVVPSQMSAWLQHLEPVDTSTAPSGKLRLTVSAPNEFSANWVRSYYSRTIEDALTQITGASPELVVLAKGEILHYESREEPQNTLQTAQMPKPQSEVSQKSPVTSPSMPPALPKSMNESGNDIREQSGSSLSSVLPDYDMGPETSDATKLDLTHGFDPVVELSRSRAPMELTLDPKYTFDSFVVGASNQFAHASAIAVAEQPGRQYNPLFLYSQPGLGKTHLLHAVGNYVLSRNPSARVAYLSAEKFMNELIESIQHKRMTQFRSKYREGYDLILIDDIQFIAGKKQTEEEFFHTFNALYGSKRQIILSSDRPPKEITGLEERIRTRFEWGMVGDIQPPEIETRIAILKAKAERDDIYLPDDVATFLATYIKSNVRELEGKLIKLQMQASLSGSEISLEMAKELLKGDLPEEGSLYTVESIQAAVAKHFGVRIQDLKAESRARKVALPRQIAMYLIRKYTRLGHKEIGAQFNGKDHSTVVHACQKLEQQLETDSVTRETVESIQNLL